MHCIKAFSPASVILSEPRVSRDSGPTTRTQAFSRKPVAQITQHRGDLLPRLRHSHESRISLLQQRDLLRLLPRGMASPCQNPSSGRGFSC